MKTTLTDTDLNEIFFEQNLPSLELAPQNSVFDTTLEPQYKTARGKMNMQYFDGVMISKGTYSSQEDILISGCNDFSDGGIEMHFNLQGSSAGKMKGEKEFLSFNQNEHNLFYYPISECDFFLSGKAKVEMMEISFSKAYFKKYENYDNLVIDHILNAIEKNVPFKFKQNGVISPQLYQCLIDIQHIDASNNLRKMLLDAKITELLALQLSLFENGHQSNKINNNALEYAGEYLKLHLHNPPSTAALAKILNTNEFKLKQNFKSYYGNTIYGYVIEQRMNYARSMILDTNCAIAVIAEKVGYSTQQHFSTAFKKFYAITPGQLRKESV